MIRSARWRSTRAARSVHRAYRLARTAFCSVSRPRSARAFYQRDSSSRFAGASIVTAQLPEHCQLVQEPSDSACIFQLPSKPMRKKQSAGLRDRLHHESLRSRAGCLSLRNARCSICRILSRETLAPAAETKHAMSLHDRRCPGLSVAPLIARPRSKHWLRVSSFIRGKP